MIKRFFTIGITACIIVLIGWFAWIQWIKPQWELQRYPIAYAELVEQSALEFGVPREIVFAVIRTESGFDANAVSHAGAKGLMQLMEETNAWIALMCGEEEAADQIFDPAFNIRRGVWLLSHHYQAFGSWREALAAYNAGYGRVSSWLKDSAYTSDGKTLTYIPIAETRSYVEKVLAAAEKYREIYT